MSTQIIRNIVNTQIDSVLSRAKQELRDEGKKIYKEYKFSNFVETLEFVNKVGALAEDEGHHPDIAFGWGYADITIFSHKIEGLHENDFILASKIDLILS